MTATPRFFRVAVAMVLGAAGPLVLRAQPISTIRAALATPGARLAVAESASPAPHHFRPTAPDTGAKREHGRTERMPTSTRRRTPRARNGAATPPAGPGSSQYLPDQPWETEFFVMNTVPSRHFAVTLASTTGYR